MNLQNEARRLGGDVTGRNTINCPGPAHSAADRSMSVTFNSDGSFVIHSFAGDDWKTCRDHVNQRLGIKPREQSRYQPAQHDRRGAVHYLWHRTMPAAGT